MKNKRIRFDLWRIGILILLISTNLVVVKSQSQTAAEDGERKIRSRDYAKEASKEIATIRPKAALSLPQKPNYKAANPDDLIAVNGVDVGFTFWGLKDSRRGDDPNVQEKRERITKIKSGNVEKEQKEIVNVTPRRLNSSNKFVNGDWLRLTLEVPISGYIYIINREQYMDGTFSTPYLIFPRKADKGRSDRTVAGKLIYIPNKIDYFEIESLSSISENRKVKSAEVYHVIIVPQPLPDLPLLDTNEPREISLAQLEKWQGWESRVWKFESEEEAEKAITSIEKLAGTEDSGVLTGNDPLPQTVYHIARKSGEPIFFTIKVGIKN